MKIEPRIVEILANAEINGKALRITRQLDRKEYVAANEALEAAGGKWSRKDKAHIFAEGAAEAIEPIILTGEISSARDFEFFETPSAIVDELISIADVKPGMRVLEPSAGRGAIVSALKEKQCHVTAVELFGKNFEVVGLLADEAMHDDFLTMKPLPIYDRVIMNPPFSKQADIKHILHAVEFLKPGGRLAAVMSAGVAFREDARSNHFRAFVSELGGQFIALGEGAFKSSGTMVRTVLVTFGIPDVASERIAA